MKKIAPVPPNFTERLLTTKEISPRLFIQPRTAALWARQGRIPAYHIGRKLGFKWVETYVPPAPRNDNNAEAARKKNRNTPQAKPPEPPKL